MCTYNEVKKIWKGRKIANPYSHSTYVGAQILDELCESPGSIIEISYEENYAMTRKELRELSINVALNLINLKVKPDDVVGVICRNSKYLTPLLYGCILVGAPINPLDVAFEKSDIKQMFYQTKPKIVLCDFDVYKTAKEALRELNINARVFTLLEKIPGVSYIEELVQPSDDKNIFVPPKFKQSSDQKILALLCTSGTTGNPKATVLSHAYFLGFIKLIAKPTSYKSLSFSPVHWASAFISTIVLPFLRNEIKVQSLKSFSIELLVELVDKHKVDALFLPPAHIHMILQSSLASTTDFSNIKLITSSGSIVTPQLKKNLREKFGSSTFLQRYGITEIGVIAQTLENVCGNEVSLEFLAPNVEVKIINEAGENLGAREQGEILVKPSVPFLGYYNNFEGTKNALDYEGFFKTGDIGYIDDDELVIVDRKKEIFKFRGYHINPSEIEDVISLIDGIAQVSVVGIPDPVYYNLTTAAVVKKNGYDNLTEQVIINHVAQHLSFYKHLIGGVVFMDSLPMSASGKILKKLIREKLAN